LKIIPVSPGSPPDDRLEEAAAILQGGGVLALPTETFYGLAADISNTDALSRLNRLKRRAAADPLLTLLGGTEQVEQVCTALPAGFHGLTRRFWPGPLTLVVPASAAVSRELNGDLRTIAIRVSGLALPRRLAQRLGRPITGPSANLHGESPCRTAVEVQQAFPEGLDAILDGGATPGGTASTILDLCTRPPRILRAGVVPAAAIRALLPGGLDGPL
jgi:L-threonylcarbamoyladenylate synthase